MFAELIQEIIDQLLYAAIDTLAYTWEGYYASFNPGQSVIFDQNISIALEDYYAELEDSWPDVDPYYYIDAMTFAYDGDVMERAFSDATWDPFDSFSEICYIAYELGFLLDAFGGGDF